MPSGIAGPHFVRHERTGITNSFQQSADLMDRTGPQRRLTATLAWALVLLCVASSAQANQDGGIPDPPVAGSAPSSGAPVSVDPVRPNAETEASTEAEVGTKPAVNRGSIRQLIVQANPMLWLLVISSIVTMGYALERIVALRKERVVPKEFVDRFLERLSNGKLDRDRAIELCKAHDSPVARVFTHVVKAWGQPALAIRQIVAYDAAGEIVELKRNVRILNAMATIGPLLGLLGTVVGIIQSFDALGGRVGPAKGEALAHGISLALVATAFGLVIALFAVAMYYYLLSRVDRLSRDLDDAARRVIDLVSAEAIQPTHHLERPQ